MKKNKKHITIPAKEDDRVSEEHNFKTMDIDDPYFDTPRYFYYGRCILYDEDGNPTKPLFYEI